MTLSPNRRRPGFSLVELLIVVVIMAIAGAVTLPAIGRSMASTRINRSAATVSVELQQARTLAGRTRRPVRVEFDPAARVMRVRDDLVPARIFSERWFNSDSEVGVQSMTAAPTSIVMYPNGLMSAGVTVLLAERGHQRQIDMTMAGQIRITAP